MIRRRCGSRILAFLCLVVAAGVSANSARGQSGAGNSSGLSLVPLPSSGGTMSMGVLPVGNGSPGSVGSRATDPMGLNYIYGGASVPMTRDQAGLYMLSNTQRMIGIGNGQISGTRPGPDGTTPQSKAAANARTRRGPARPAQENGRAPSTHRRDANSPGGLASRYFNKPTTTVGVSNRESHFNRPLRYFPQRGQ